MQLLERSLSDEHREIRDRADEYAQNVVSPRAAAIEAADEFPRDVIEAAGDAGLLGIMLPEAYGGQGSDFLAYTLALERIAEASGAVAETIQGHTFAALPIAHHGTEAQRETWLPKMASGEAVGAMLLTEPGAGSSPSELATVAEATHEGERTDGSRGSADGPSAGGYRLTGEKAFGTNAGVADVHLVVARRRPKPEDSHGVSVFLVPSVDDTDGFTFERAAFMGMRGHVTGDSTLDDVHVDSDALLGEVGQGFRIAMGTIDMARTGLGAIGTGIAQAAYADAVDYAGTRRQGGSAIGEYQAVQVLVAKMGTRLDAARHLVYESAATIADDGGDTRKSSQAKYFASDVAEFVTRNAMQVYGGKGYKKDYPLERYFRDAKILSLIGGTTEIQQTTVATESLSL